MEQKENELTNIVSSGCKRPYLRPSAEVQELGSGCSILAGSNAKATGTTVGNMDYDDSQWDE